MSIEIRHAEAEVNGVRLHYAAAGAGSLVMFVHGFPEFWYEWHRQLVDFGRDHLAVAPDMRGYNLSSRPTELDDYTVPKLVEDIRALAEHLGHRRFTLVGHDWGGAVAWAFAMVHPGMLERAVLINAPHPESYFRTLTRSVQLLRSWYIFFFQLRGLAEWLITRRSFFGWMLRSLVANKARLTRARIEAGRRELLRPGAARE